MKKIKMLIIVLGLGLLVACSPKKQKLDSLIKDYRLEEAEGLALEYMDEKKPEGLDSLLRIYKIRQDWQAYEDLKLGGLDLNLSRTYYQLDCLKIYMARGQEAEARDLIDSISKKEDQKRPDLWMVYYLARGEVNRAYEIFLEGYRKDLYGSNIENTRIIDLVEALGPGRQARDLLDNYLDRKEVSEADLGRLLETFKEDGQVREELTRSYLEKNPAYGGLGLYRIYQEGGWDLAPLMEELAGQEGVDQVYDHILSYAYEELGEEKLEDIVWDSGDYRLEYFISSYDSGLRIYSYDLETGDIGLAWELEGYRDYDYENQEDFILWGRSLIFTGRRPGGSRLIYLSRDRAQDVFEIELRDDLELRPGQASSKSLGIELELKGSQVWESFETRPGGRLYGLLTFYRDGEGQKLQDIVVKEYRLSDLGYFEFVGLRKAY